MVDHPHDPRHRCLLHTITRFVTNPTNRENAGALLNEHDVTRTCEPL